MMDDDLRVTHIRPVRKQSPLEELGKQLRRQFGGGGGGSNGGRPPKKDGPNVPTGKLLVLIALIALLVWGTFTSFYTVDVSEEAVVTRFGAYNRTTGSGMHFMLPFGIEKAIKVQSKRVLEEEFGYRTAQVQGGQSRYSKQEFENESLMLTGDLNVADVEWMLQYTISDPWKYLFHARDVSRNIRDASMSIMRRVVGDRLVGNVLTMGRVEIADQAKQLTQEVLDQYDMGIKVERIVLQDVNPPEKVKPAFNEVNAAKQEQEQTVNNAERAYNKIIPESRGKAEQVIANAEAYAIDIVNRAKGDATKFKQIVESYRSAPEITRRRLYLETMEQVLPKVDKLTVVDGNIKGLLPIYPTPTSTGPSSATTKSH